MRYRVVSKVGARSRPSAKSLPQVPFLADHDQGTDGGIPIRFCGNAVAVIVKVLHSLRSGSRPTNAIKASTSICCPSGVRARKSKRGQCLACVGPTSLNTGRSPFWQIAEVFEVLSLQPKLTPSPVLVMASLRAHILHTTNEANNRNQLHSAICQRSKDVSSGQFSVFHSLARWQPEEVNKKPCFGSPCTCDLLRNFL